MLYPIAVDVIRIVKLVRLGYGPIYSHVTRTLNSLAQIIKAVLDMVESARSVAVRKRSIDSTRGLSAATWVCMKFVSDHAEAMELMTPRETVLFACLSIGERQARGEAMSFGMLDVDETKAFRLETFPYLISLVCWCFYEGIEFVRH